MSKNAVCYIVVVICACTAACLAKYSGGNGTAEYPYLIATPNDLNAIGTDPNDWDKHFKMIADINLAGFAGTQFNIIGPNTSTPFTGVFDGNDNQIQRFTYLDKTRAKAGIFGRTTENSEIRNVHLVDVNLCGYYDVGGLVGYNRGKIEQCSVTGVVSGTWDVGGLVGENNGGWIEKCSADITIQNYGPQDSVGCLVGFNNSDTDIIDCSSAGIVDGNDNTNLAGGLVGSNYGRIKRCFSTAEVKGSWCVGGLIGVHNEYDLENCFATGNISAEVRGGGLVGFNKYTIINCYATGDVNCTEAAGGLIGEDSSGGAINCYSTGYVTGNEYVGGLVGRENTYEHFIGCFWDVNTSGQTTSAAGIGKTTTEMQDAETFKNWICWEVWKINDGNDYPKLFWQTDLGEPILRPAHIYAGGSGSQEDPYLIDSPEHLLRLSVISCDWDKHFILTSDLDMINCDSSELGRIGGYSVPFTGVFDGDNHRIINLEIHVKGEDSVGLFGTVQGPNSAVINLSLINPNVQANGLKKVGAIIGSLGDYGTMSRCSSRGGSVSGYHSVGGLVGYIFLNGQVINCYSSTNVFAEYCCAGGLVGYLNSSSIFQSYSTSNVLTHRSCHGLVGVSKNGQVYESFWDTETSDCNVSDGGTGLTTVEMQTESTFTDAGWDFIGERANGYDDTWRMCVDGVDYPRLTWEFTSYGDLICPDGVDFTDYSVLADQWILEKLYADMTNDGRVNLRDFAAWANQWQGDYSLLKELAQNWLAHSAGIADIAPAGGDDFVDWLDLRKFCENWLDEK